VSAIILDEGLVHYEVLGHGRPLVFLHGWLGSWRYWMPTMDSLSDRFRAYAFDMWGFGDSDRNPQRYSLEAYVAQLDLFMEELGVMKASLVGHSMGAAVALLFATLYPNRVDRIVAVSTPLAGAAVSKRLLTGGGGSLLDRMLGRRAVSDYPEVEMEATKTDFNAVAATARSLDTLNLRGTLSELGSIPTLLVYGNKDPFVTPLTNDDLRDRDGYVRSIGLNDSGHFPMLDEASKFQRLLRDFLDARPEDLNALTLKDEWRRRMHCVPATGERWCIISGSRRLYSTGVTWNSDRGDR
jgi:pimeloyl-ACP methyl ester carboxylesterase